MDGRQRFFSGCEDGSISGRRRGSRNLRSSQPRVFLQHDDKRLEIRDIGLLHRFKVEIDPIKVVRLHPIHHILDKRVAHIRFDRCAEGVRGAVAAKTDENFNTGFVSIPRERVRGGVVDAVLKVKTAVGLGEDGEIDDVCEGGVVDILGLEVVLPTGVLAGHPHRRWGARFGIDGRWAEERNRQYTDQYKP